MCWCEDQSSFRDTELRLLGALGARGGSASPGELRDATAVPARTVTRALGRLDASGYLAERSKRSVRLSASGWALFSPADPARSLAISRHPPRRARRSIAREPPRRGRLSIPVAYDSMTTREMSASEGDHSEITRDASHPVEEPADCLERRPSFFEGFWAGLLGRYEP